MTRTALDAAKQVVSVEQCIARVEDPKIERGGRSLDDWLAQVLQVLVMERGNAITERDRIARAVIEFKCPTCDGKRTIRQVFTTPASSLFLPDQDVPCPTCTPLMSALEGLTK